MTLIIPQALPSGAHAQALLEPFASRYPKLVHLFNAKLALTKDWLTTQHGCTPAEGLKLQDLGFEAPATACIGAGLGPWHATESQTDHTVWVAQMCATVISQERATILPLALVEAAQSDIAALEQSASPLFGDDGDGIQITPLSDGLWRVHADFPENGRTISPMALAGQDLGDWWPTESAWRSWRKRVNEIQMAWHDHPVNQARELRGLPPINSVWLYGGAKGFEPKTNPQTQWLDALAWSATRDDWSSWLEAWATIEDSLLAAGPDTEIVLTGEDRIVHLHNAPKRWWQNLFARERQNTWRKWWLNQN